MLEPHYIEELVDLALAEDVGSGDLTAGLINAESRAKATVITRETGVLCGRDFVSQTFRAVDPDLTVDWHKIDGDALSSDDVLFTVSGSARSILTAERTALNFLQFLSGTATRCRQYADMVADTRVRLLDTRKTIPGFRMAQKYAVRCGGCYNHRMGLYDAFLIKENHIEACGGIAQAVTAARSHGPGKPVEVEVENLKELNEALASQAERIMLDNFSLTELAQAVQLTQGQAELEASGNVTEETLAAIAGTGVDFISIGALTKGVEPLDLSLRLHR